MMDNSHIIRSPLCHKVKSDGVTVQVEIYRADDSDAWVLELIDEEGSSTIWQETFLTDEAALAEFANDMRTIGLMQLVNPNGEDVVILH